MANQEEFTLSNFKKRFKSGEYGSKLGANRAIGRGIVMTEAEKETARKMVAKSDLPDLPPKGRKKAAKKAKAKAKRAPKAAKKAAKAEKKAAKKATKKVVAKPEKMPKKRQAKSAPPKRAPKQAKVQRTPVTRAHHFRRAVDVGQMTAEQLRNNPLAKIDAGTRIMGTVTEAVKAMRESRELFQEADIARNMNLGSRTFGRSVQLIESGVGQLLGSDEELSPEEQKAVEILERAKATSARGGNGAVKRAGRAAPAPEVSEDEPEDEVEARV